MRRRSHAPARISCAGCCPTRSITLREAAGYTTSRAISSASIMANPGGRLFRRHLSEQAVGGHVQPSVVEDAIAIVVAAQENAQRRARAHAAAVEAEGLW